MFSLKTSLLKKNQKSKKTPGKQTKICTGFIFVRKARKIDVPAESEGKYNVSPDFKCASIWSSVFWCLKPVL